MVYISLLWIRIQTTVTLARFVLEKKRLWIKYILMLFLLCPYKVGGMWSYPCACGKLGVCTSSHTSWMFLFKLSQYNKHDTKTIVKAAICDVVSFVRIKALSGLFWHYDFIITCIIMRQIGENLVFVTPHAQLEEVSSTNYQITSI